MFDLLERAAQPAASATSATVLASELDASVNFVTPAAVGFEEARYVRRNEEYFITYLSAQSGCRMACRFCHLTQTGQTAFMDVPVEGLFAQADQVLGHYDSLGQPARSVHFNFMARGEVLASEHVLAGADELIDGLAERAVARGLVPRYKFSTIMPRSLGDLALTDIFTRSQPDVYLSVYSADPAFRRRWLPKAQPLAESLAKLVDWQRLTRKIPVLHWALIEGANDDPGTLHGICDAVQAAGLICDVNLVRYNPYSPKQGREPSEAVIQRCAQILRDRLPMTGRVKVVGRVGFDVKASCGMFVGGRR